MYILNLKEGGLVMDSTVIHTDEQAYNWLLNHENLDKSDNVTLVYLDPHKVDQYSIGEFLTNCYELN